MFWVFRHVGLICFSSLSLFTLLPCLLCYTSLLWYCSRILFMLKYHDFLSFPPSLQPQIKSFNIISNSHKITHQTIFQFLTQPHNFFSAILHSFISKLKPTTSTWRQFPNLSYVSRCYGWSLLLVGPKAQSINV